MGFVVRELAGDPEPIARLLTTPPEVLLGLCALIVLNQSLMSQRFSLAVAHCGGTGVPARVWFRLISVGQMLNLFVPQLGSVYRGVALKREFGVTYMSYASGLLAFVWLDIVMGFAIATVAVALVHPDLTLGSLVVLPWVGLATLAVLAAPPVVAHVVARLPIRSPYLAKIHARVATLLSTAASGVKAPAFMLRYLALNVLVTAVQVSTLVLLFDSAGANVPLTALILFQVVLKAAGQIVITPGNLGITELLFGVLAQASRCTLEQGLAVSLLYRGVSTVMVIALGVAFGGARLLLHDRRRIEAEASREPE